MALQASPQTVPSAIPPDAFAVDAPSSRHHYAQPSPQLSDSYRSTGSPQSTRRPARRPSANGTHAEPPLTPQQPQSQSPNLNYPSSGSTARALPMAPTSHASSGASMAATSSPQPVSRREMNAELSREPPVPPARTSSNQRGASMSSPAEAALVDRTRQRDDGKRIITGDDPRWNQASRSRDDPNANANATSATREGRDITPPNGPQRSSSTRAIARPHQSPGNSQGRSAAANVQSQARRAEPSPVGEVIKRVVVTDPEVDVIREKERQAEAIPSTPGTDHAAAVSQATEGGTDANRRTRQDFSATTARRKETKFGAYVLGQTLGEGEFGKVKLGWKKDGSVQVAIKLIRRENLSTNPTRLPKIHREITILSELSHPNIVRLHEMVETDRYIGIILEYASGGELFDYILTNRFLKDNAARRLFAQLVSGVGYLHKKGIVHRDLKLENLLLDRNRNIIITDFGFANKFDPRDELGEEIEYNLANKDYVKQMDLDRITNGVRRGDLMQTSCGSPCYAAPELVVTESLYTGRKVDVWSCGVILYAMLAGYLPFDDDPANPEGDNINLLYKYIVNTPLTFPEYITPHARDLLRRILVPDPRKRADLFEVARHSWLSEYAHVVSHVTSSTTTVGEISNTTVTSDHYMDAPLLARSASVREPSKPHASNISPVGGLSHQGKIDPDQVEKAKEKRHPNRRTVQVEYVAPQSQTVRGEMSPPMPQPAIPGIPAGPRDNTRGQPGNQVPSDTQRKPEASSSARKPLPRDPPNFEDVRLNREIDGTGRSQDRPSSSGMLPPARPARDTHSAADSNGVFAAGPGASIVRPTTGGSISSSGGRLASRGNSYSQVLAPTVAATNAQGRLAQPKNPRILNISSPVLQPEPYISDASLNRPASQRIPSRYSQTPSAKLDNGKTHKRSSTLSNVFQRSSSLFGGRPPAEVPDTRHFLEKKYPPTSMKTTIVSDSNPRTSSDSRRPSFGFSRKNSDLSSKEKKRFSLLPASFSFKSFVGSSKSEASDSSRQFGERRATFNQAQSQGGAFARGRSRTNSEESMPVYDGSRENNRHASGPISMVQAQQLDVPKRGTSAGQLQQPEQYSHWNTIKPIKPLTSHSTALQPAPSQYQNEFVAPTVSDVSVGQQPRLRYPPGFNSFEDEPRPSLSQGRTGRGVLQKSNRKFADAYEQDQDASHAGSSGAAKRVMDFFRRRGKARSGDDR